jgi:hypothetical protein
MWVHLSAGTALLTLVCRRVLVFLGAGGTRLSQRCASAPRVGALRSGIDKPVRGEERHRLSCGPQGKVRFCVPVVKARCASMKRGRKSR